MSDRNSVLAPVIGKVFANDEEYRNFGEPRHPVALSDFVFATENEDHDPARVFPRVRWGGQFVFASNSLKRTQDTANRFARYGFLLEIPPSAIPTTWKFWPFLRNKVFYFTARKILHIPRGELTDRFTFEVELSVCHEKHKGKHVVTKRVPSVEWVMNRLRNRNLDMTEEEMQRRAQQLIRNILPIFLTREVSIMRRLQELLPQEYRTRVPHTIHYERDERGMVNLLQVNWLRNGGDPISQLDFALQSAELLHLVHDKAGVVHLDLRLDNMVITPDGVGFIDFGSSVHVDEDMSASPTLQKIFTDLMRTCQVQRVMHKMIQAGHVTSPYFTNALFKMDKAVDLFYLTLQFTTPHDNPDLKDFITYSPNGPEDYALHKLTRRLFVPDRPEKSEKTSAGSVASALRIIQKRMVQA
jgi:tRNA A-37 threonylcarbamoyl transferase component Bud32